jgi:hypothetical protein
VPGVVEGYLFAAQSAVTLLAQHAVAERWAAPSALPRMTVGALAAHLATEVTLVRDVLVDRRLRSSERPVPLLEHYTRSAWVRAGLDDEANVSIRQTADAGAAAGHRQLLESVQEALDDVARLLAEEVEPRVVRLPWWGWSLTFEDFLVTRMMEITVHSDDLAVSLGQEPPELPVSVLEPVLSLLLGVSVLRHGQAAVVRALSRAERAPGSIAAF